MKIQKKKKNSSAGHDGLNSKLFRPKWLTGLLNKVWMKGKLPTEWRKAVIYPIRKN